MTAYTYADSKWEETLKVVDETGPYALTGAIFSDDRAALLRAADVLRDAAGNVYFNDKPTGAVVGQQPFGGARASGTNDKAGSMWNLARWVSPRTIKETFNPADRLRLPLPRPRCVTCAAAPVSPCRPRARRPRSPRLPHRAQPTERTLWQRTDSLVRSDARARAYLAWTIRDIGVDSVSLALGRPFASSDGRLAEHDARDRAAGWPRLRDDTLHSGRELRIGMMRMRPGPLLRLVEHGDGAARTVEGAMLGPDDGPLPRREARCTNADAMRQAPGAECLYRFPTPPDWRGLWDRLDRAGVWMLPDESTVPTDPNRITLDGTSIRVELRNGPLYRIYDLHDSGDGYDAAIRRIADLLYDVQQARVQPDTLFVEGTLWRDARGVWMRPCHRDATWRVRGFPIASDALSATRGAASPYGVALEGALGEDRDGAPTFDVTRLLFLHDRPSTCPE